MTDGGVCMASAGASLYNFGICKIGVHFLPDGDIIRENAGRRKTDLERDIERQSKGFWEYWEHYGW